MFVYPASQLPKIRDFYFGVVDDDDADAEWDLNICVAALFLVHNFIVHLVELSSRF